MIVRFARICTVVLIVPLIATNGFAKGLRQTESNDTPDFSFHWPEAPYRHNALIVGGLNPLTYCGRSQVGQTLFALNYCQETPLLTLNQTPEFAALAIGTFGDLMVGRHNRHSATMIGAGRQIRVGFGYDRSRFAQPYVRLGGGVYALQYLRQQQYNETILILPGFSVAGGIEQSSGLFLETGFRYIPRYRGIATSGFLLSSGLRF